MALREAAMTFTRRVCLENTQAGAHPPAVEGDLVATQVQVPVRKHADELRQQRRQRRVGAVDLTTGEGMPSGQ